MVFIMKKTLLLKIILPVLVLIFLVTISCVNHNLETITVKVSCDGFKTVSFNDDIKPIITSNCAIGSGTCHNGGNGPDLDWRVFLNFQNHSNEVKRRVALPSNDPDHMPRIGQLTFDQIQLIVCWVEQGANNN